MDVSEYQLSHSVVVNRDAEALYDMIADISQMGRWSPVSTGGTYDEDGTWFTGTNTAGDRSWQTRCQVVVADRGREFAFINRGSKGTAELVRWGYEFEPESDGATRVTETWQVLPTYLAGLGVGEERGMAMLENMRELAVTGLPATLQALKAAAEANPTG